MNIEYNESCKNNEIYNDFKQIDLDILIKLKNINNNLFKTLNEYLKEIDNFKYLNQNTNPITQKLVDKNIYYSRNGSFDVLGCLIKGILEDTENIMDELCDHEIEEDDIDIGPETSKRIYYCKKCLETFNEK